MTGTDEQIRHARQLIGKKIGERGSQGDFNQGDRQNWNQQVWRQPLQGIRQPQQYGQQQQYGRQQPPQQQVRTVDLSMYDCRGDPRDTFSKCFVKVKSLWLFLGGDASVLPMRAKMRTDVAITAGHPNHDKITG